MLNYDSSDFFVAAREPGAENPAIPTWANRSADPVGLACIPEAEVRRKNIEGVPGCFQLLNVLPAQACDDLCTLAEALGFVADAAVSLPRSIRHNDSMTWVVDDRTSELLWSRCDAAINGDSSNHAGRRALGLNNRFRFYRYGPGDYFRPHTDGSWPGSRVVDGNLIANAFDDRWSELTFLLFLSEDYEGGYTEFYTAAGTESEVPRSVQVRTARGDALCFPHGSHPLHCVHGSTPITSGVKYIIRSDVLFEI